LKDLISHSYQSFRNSFLDSAYEFSKRKYQTKQHVLHNLWKSFKLMPGSRYILFLLEKTSILIKNMIVYSIWSI